MLKALVPAIVCLAFLTGGCGADDSEDVGPQPTVVPLTLEQLASLTVPGFTTSGSNPTLLGTSVTYLSNATTASGAQLTVVVRLVPCDEFVCGSLDPNEYDSAQQQRDLKSILPTAHIENPGLRWEFGTARLSPKAEGLSVYAVSYLESTATDGAVSRSSANTYFAWFHNDGTYMNISVSPRGGAAPMTATDVEARMSKAEAETAVTTVFAAFEPHLPKK